MGSHKYSVEDVRKAISDSSSWSKVCLHIGLKIAGGNIGTIKNIAVKYEMDFSHFKGRGWNLGGDGVNEIDYKDVFKVNGRVVSNGTLRNKVIKYNLLGKIKCEECGIEETWNSKFLVLHLDHINADKGDNRIENLRFLCPNCHSQTKTYCVSNQASKLRRFCNGCNVPIKSNNKSGFCIKCYQENIMKKN